MKSRYSSFLFITSAYVISVLFRLIWLLNSAGQNYIKWNHQYIVTTLDGFLWASAIQKFLLGMHAANPLIPNIFDHLIIFLGFVSAKILPFKIDTITFYMPIITAGLVAIPIYYICRLIMPGWCGFAAAVIGTLGHSFFNRTCVGYFDTDMFSVFLLLIIVYFLLKTLKEKSINYAFAASMAAYFYPFFYSSGIKLVYGTVIFYILYTVLFYRRETFALKAVIIISLGLTPFNFIPDLFIINFPVNWLIKTAILTGIFFILKKDSDKSYYKYVIILSSVVSFLLFIFIAHPFKSILSHLMLYTVRQPASEGLKFFPSMDTVIEAGTPDFALYAARISGSIPGLIISIAGYILLLIKKRDFVITLPAVGLGLAAIFTGLRFTIYALPFFAISAVYIIYFLTSKIKGSAFISKYLKTAAFCVIAFLILIPSIIHIINFVPRPAQRQSTISMIQRLKDYSSPGDYVITWWDFGSAVWYYSGLNTLTAPSTVNSPDNFAVSYILMSDSQRAASNLSKLCVENFIENIVKDPNKGIYLKGAAIDKIFNTRGKDIINPEVFLKSLESINYTPDYTNSKNIPDIFLFLPYDILYLFNTISEFSEYDLLSGQKDVQRVIQTTKALKEDNNTITFLNKMALDKNSAEIILDNGSKIPLKSFYFLYYDASRRLQVRRVDNRQDSIFSVIYHKDLDIYILLNDQAIKTNFIQMYLFDKYDPNFFEPLNLSLSAKIYKVKRRNR